MSKKFFFDEKYDCKLFCKLDFESLFVNSNLHLDNQRFWFLQSKNLFRWKTWPQLVLIKQLVLLLSRRLWEEGHFSLVKNDHKGIFWSLSIKSMVKFPKRNCSSIFAKLFFARTQSNERFKTNLKKNETEGECINASIKCFIVVQLWCYVLTYSK